MSDLSPILFLILTLLLYFCFEQINSEVILPFFVSSTNPLSWKLIRSWSHPLFWMHFYALNPNNWRGISLLDVVSKAISIVITNRLQLVLKQIGTPMQFGSTPETWCPYGSFSIMTLLQMRKVIDKSTWVVFVDLIKAFDSINHQLLFKLLEKIEIPNRVILVITNLYKNFKIKLTVG